MQLTTPLLSYLKDTTKIAPMLLIEVPTSAGRTYQGYKRGGKAEARERVCEESLGAAVWLFGVASFNKIGDFIGEKILKLKDLSVDTGCDSLRNPSSYIKDRKLLCATYKFSKIGLSAILGSLAMGVAVPKIKMSMTNAFRMQNGLEPIPNKNSKDGKFHPIWSDKLVSCFIKYNKEMINVSGQMNHDDDENQKIGPINVSMEDFIAKTKNQKSSSTAFKGALDKILYATHNLENNTAWRLLSTDAGTLTGRVANSRNKKEGIEYFVRDSISSFAYIFAAPLFTSLIRKISNTPNIHPKGANNVGELLKAELRKNPNLGIDEISENILNTNNNDFAIQNLVFDDNGTIPLERFQKQTGGIFFNKANEMSKLQPEYITKDGVKYSILSKMQVDDIASNSITSDPKFLKKAISDVTGGKSDDVRRFISRKKLEEIRESFDDYIRDFCKYAEKHSKDKKITENIIDKYTKNLNRKSLFMHLAGIGFAVFLLADLIPKFQYWVSEKLTGVKEFPGTIGYADSKTDM